MRFLLLNQPLPSFGLELVQSFCQSDTMAGVSMNDQQMVTREAEYRWKFKPEWDLSKCELPPHPLVLLQH